MQTIIPKAPIRPPYLLLLCSIIVFLPMVLLPSLWAGDGATIDCDIHHGACKKLLSGGTNQVILDISPKPVTAMRDLVFQVRLGDFVPAAPPYIDLGMPGMKMGPNRVHLKKSKDGSYSGSGIIVRCPSGKKLWQATVTVPGTGVAEFRFNVVY